MNNNNQQFGELIIMKRPILLLLPLIFLLNAVAHGDTIYVAPNGSDTNPGTQAQPLKTLLGARDKLRTVASSDNIVYFRAGIYPVINTVLFDANDSGDSNSAPNVFASYPGEVAFFDGLQKIDSSKFSLVFGALLDRIPPEAQGKAYSQVITDPSLITLLGNDEAGITYGNRMMRLSRFPEVGFAHVKYYFPGSEPSTGTGDFSNPLGASFQMKESIDWTKYQTELARKGNQAFITGYVSADWYKEKLRIAYVGSAQNFQLVDRAKYGFMKAGVERFAVKNVLYAMNQPGEWFFDKLDNRLYIIPYSNSVVSTTIGVWAGPTAIRIQDANNLTFQGLVFQNLGKGVNGDAAIDVRKGDSINIYGSTFRFIASPLLAVNFWEDARNCSIYSSDFYDLPNATRLYGGGYTPSSITKGNNRIQNSHFTQVDSQDFYGKATGILGAGNVFKNNLVHNMNGQPITHSGFDNVIELNEVFNVGIEEGDGGAIYTGGNIWSYGNIIRYNFMHHIMSIPDLIGRAAFYSDDFDGGDTYAANVLYKAGDEVIKMNSGSGHTVSGNVIMSGRHAIKLLGSTAAYQASLTKALGLLKSDPNSTAKENYIGRAEKILGDFANDATGAYNVAWDNSFYGTRYPALKFALRTSNHLAMFPAEIRVYDNMYYDNADKFTHPAGYGANRGDQDISLSLFVNPNIMDFTFKSPRPAFAPNIPFQSIGLYTDTFRKAMPDKNNYRKVVKDHWAVYKSYDDTSYNSDTINARIYFNTGNGISAESQRGLGHDVTPLDTNATQYNYDFGTSTSPVTSGWTAITPNTTGDISWSASVDSRDRGAGGGVNDINRDFVFSNKPITLRHKIANGTWGVILNMGDKTNPHDLMAVKAEGILQKNNINNAAGEFPYVTFDVTVNDGQLDIEFSDAGGSDANWVVTRMTLTKK
jgi:hypothetical protein